MVVVTWTKTRHTRPKARKNGGKFENRAVSNATHPIAFTFTDHLLGRPALFGMGTCPVAPASIL